MRVQFRVLVLMALAAGLGHAGCASGPGASTTAAGGGRQASADRPGRDLVAARGHLDEAQRSLAMVEDAKQRQAQLSALCVMWAEAGDMARARTLVNELDADGRAGTQMMISRQAARAGDLEAAIETARAIGSDYGRQRALGGVAAERGLVGDMEGASRVLGLVTDPWARDRALSGMAVGQARGGDKVGARATAGKITESAAREQTLRLIESGGDAEPGPSRTPMQERRAVMMLFIGERAWAAPVVQSLARARTGDAATARAELESVRRRVATLREPLDRSCAQVLLADAHVAMGQREAALDSLARAEQAMREDAGKAAVPAALPAELDVLVRLGEVDRAARLVEETSPEHRVQACEALAGSLVFHGHNERFAAWGKALTDPPQRAAAHMGAAHAMLLIR